MRQLFLLAAALLVVHAAAGREWQYYDTPVTGGDYHLYPELRHDEGTFAAWGTAPGWAAEVQVGFEMPEGGPWLVSVVRLWLSGTAEHSVILRDASASLSAAPGDIIDDTIAFTPGYPGPPDRWVDVDISLLGLVLIDDDPIYVGVALDGIDDGLGMETTDPTGHTWGYYGGEWVDDTYIWSFDAAIRLVLTEMVFANEMTTWGGIKALYRD